MRNITFTLLVLFAMQLTGQDFIILKNGDEIKAKVLEINDNSIDYKRFTNVNGPTYHLNKSEIFMIKYESGDKDVFNASASAVATTTTKVEYKATVVKSTPVEFVYDPDIGTSNCQVQKSTGAKIFGSKANEVFYRQDLVFYGYDMTYVRLTNPRKMGESMQLVQKYFNDWNNEFNKNVSYNNFKKWMNKPYMLLGTPVFPNYYKRDFNKFVDYNNYCISFEDLQKVVDSYVIKETSGIGMVINLVDFNKGREYSMQWVTFFDIETREIMYAVLTTGEAGGGGMVGHWAEGVEKGVRDIFIDEIFKRKLSNNGMIPSKIRLY